VRELENVLERALLLFPGQMLGVEALRLGSPTPADAAGLAPGTTLHDAERIWILRTLETLRGNRTRAASALGISVRTLRNKLREYRSVGRLPEEGTR
jgi:DNA-binding NtrC family response regulator